MSIRNELDNVYFGRTPILPTTEVEENSLRDLTLQMLETPNEATNPDINPDFVAMDKEILLEFLDREGTELIVEAKYGDIHKTTIYLLSDGRFLEIDHQYPAIFEDDIHEHRIEVYLRDSNIARIIHNLEKTTRFSRSEGVNYNFHISSDVAFDRLAESDE